MREENYYLNINDMETVILGYCRYGEIRIGHYNGKWHVFGNGEYWASDTDIGYLENRFDPNVLDDDYEQEILSQILDQEDLIERDYAENYWNLSPSKGYYE
jgi:hypothetical protein